MKELGKRAIPLAVDSVEDFSSALLMGYDGLVFGLARFQFNKKYKIYMWRRGWYGIG